jgi:uncharacterized DUF497 family protein
MRIVFDEAKRRTNLRKHALDFVDADHVFAGITYTIEDKRFEYGERRFLTLGLLKEIIVAIAHSETRNEIRVISMRKATRHEETVYFQNI